MVKRVVGIVFFVLLGLQFYQPKRNLDPGAVPDTDFIQIYEPPEEVGLLLQRSCYDCHSSHTDYKWFDFIQPGRSIVEHHIKNAKAEVNFSEWGNYSTRKQARLLRTVKSQIEDRSMPLPSYLLLHSEARMSGAEITEITDWLNGLE